MDILNNREIADVPTELGWSPYKAKDFLSNEGVCTGFYNNLYEDEWSASSPMEEFGDGIIPDNIAYYVEGTEEVAKTLKLKANVNDAARSRMVLKKLAELAEALNLAGLNQCLSDQMKDAIIQGEPYSERCENNTISLVEEKWLGHRFNGYDLKFIISSI